MGSQKSSIEGSFSGAESNGLEENGFFKARSPDKEDPLEDFVYGESNDENGFSKTRSSDEGPETLDPSEGFMYGESHKKRVISSKVDFFRGANGGSMIGQLERGVLDIFIHHAFGIHNICIFEQQDVYAKVFWSHTPEEALSTKIVKKGGKNPVFNERLQIRVENLDWILKCEVWMSSQAVNYLEDQVLGFVLVPLYGLVGKGKVTEDYALSSSELFHSHAGTIKLSFLYQEHEKSRLFDKMAVPTSELLFSQHGGSERPIAPYDELGRSKGFNKIEVPGNEAIGSQPEGKYKGTNISDVFSNSCRIEKLLASDYGNIEFQDIQDIAEDAQMVYKYLSAVSKEEEGKEGTPRSENVMITGPPFLQVKSLRVDPCLVQSGEEHCKALPSMADGCQLFNYDGMPVLNIEHDLSVDSSINGTQSSVRSQMEGGSPPSSINYHTSPGSQTASGSSNGQGVYLRLSALSTSMQMESPTRELGSVAKKTEDLGASMQMECPTIELGRVAKEGEDLGANVVAPCVDVSVDTEPKVVQQQIVDMYMKSMQQFTEALAKMQLPMDVDSQEVAPPMDSSSEHDIGESGKKNSHRVFYGSRAFF